MFPYSTVLIAFIVGGCMNAKHNHDVDGEAKIRVIAQQEICTEKNGFKTDEQKRACVMSFVDCKGDSDGDNADEGETE